MARVGKRQESHPKKSKPISTTDPLFERLLATVEGDKEFESQIKPAGGIFFPALDVLIIVATEDENKHILDDRLKDVERKPSPIAKSKKYTAEQIELTCGKRKVNALLVNLFGKGEARACAVLQHLLWQLNLTHIDNREAGGEDTAFQTRRGLPKLIVNLGISATMHKDVRLGDVVIAETLERYLEEATCVDLKDKDDSKKIIGFDIDPRRVTEPTIDTFTAKLVSSMTRDNSKLIQNWQKTCEDTVEKCELVRDTEEGRIKTAITALRRAEEKVHIAKKELEHLNEGSDKRVPKQQLNAAVEKLPAAKKTLEKAKAIDNPLMYRTLCDARVVTKFEELKPKTGIVMSGPLLVDSSVFKAKIAERDNFLALDMESGGIGWAWQEIPIHPRPKLLILRGISDYGDGTKRDTDAAAAGNTDATDTRVKALAKIADGAIRKIAMLRTWDLMVCLLGEGICEGE